ncbi:HNH endonuclease [Paraconexibacter antarcticus]|uniref:HNH endonuclease n=1 Tax=Paraconexibacter antarcticus TaxID=2949664 RepID=A0ABY5DU89_9ACTN|nr:HNH endonuclease [Paraconexibacter antarcticus]UTI65588.1 HNH endonuclease [Paraconexibacter antarcticus]
MARSKKGRKGRARREIPTQGKASPVLRVFRDGTHEVVRPGELAKRKRRPKSKGAYAAYLRSPAWKKIRGCVLERDDHACTSCGSKRKLQVHHLTYERVGAEHLADLTTLCDGCHRKTHGLLRGMGLPYPQHDRLESDDGHHEI